MILKFYGTRGSLPVCEPGFQEFGGNTTCVAILDGDDDVLVFDAGTGIRNLGKDLMKNPNIETISLLFSHYHWDHIQGFPFFAPAYDPSRSINFFALGKDRSIKNLKEVFGQQMEETFFPVQLDNMGATFSFVIHEADVVEFPGGRLEINPHNHPGGARGYRLETKGKIVVYCTDVEHGDTIDESVVNLARNADILIHEAQYTPEELPNFRGWGHSSWEQAIEVAERANVDRLYLTHHDPDHNDIFLKEVESTCQKRFSKCWVARDGMEVEV